MKLQALFLATHTVVAGTTATLFVIAFPTGTATAFVAATTLSLVTLAATVWFTGGRIRAGLASLESVVSDHERSENLTTGLEEFDRSAKRIGKCAARWETVAANTREQAREFQSMIKMLNRRGATGEPSSGQLRDLLAGLGNTLSSQLNQIESGATKIDQYTRTITDGAEEQRHVVIKTTAHVEQLSSTIDSVASNANSVWKAVEHASQSTSAAQGLLSELIDGLTRVRAQSQTCEKKLNGLSDPSRQISAIVGTISDIAARTDLLALNASIESIRAGEHGRGFAIVADEVRKLAEQAAGATREISSLVDSMQLVTQESIRGIAREREQVDSEVERAVSARQALDQICEFSEGTSEHIRQITQSSTQQLRLAQDVVLAIEQISKIAKTHRGSAESASWTMKALSDSTPQFSSAVERLRSCGGMSAIEPDENDHSHAVAPAIPVAFPVSSGNTVSVG